MDGELVQQVTVVGGGTAGWLTALMLNGKLNKPNMPRRVEIALIESPNVPTVGVGEGTLPSIVAELKALGINEKDFLRECNASFKMGVRFEGWNLDANGQEYSFIHPFGGMPQQLDDAQSILHFLEFGAQPGRAPNDVADSLTGGAEAIRLHKAPRPTTGEPFTHVGPARYSYHFDAASVAVFMRKLAIQAGVKHIVDDVDDATVENGHVTELHLRRGGVWPVEFVVDCTGFQSLLLGKHLGEPFVPYSSNLLCDRAIPIQIPYAEGQPMEVCTSATAMSAGWIWKVPLYSRIGTGYVFSSAFQDDDAALLEICNHLKLDPNTVNSRVIRMRVGKMRRFWVGNCVAIGLSGGFIEPLEATAIQTIMISVNELVKNFPTKSMPQPLIDQFNRRMDIAYEIVRDFIGLHYCLSNREEEFWRAARAPSVLSDSLKDKLELWRYRLPEQEDLPARILFSDVSFAVCLASKGYYKGTNVAARARPSKRTWEGYSQLLERRMQEVRRLPSAREFLSDIRGEAPETKYVVYDRPPNPVARAAAHA